MRLAELNVQPFNNLRYIFFNLNIVSFFESQTLKTDQLRINEEHIFYLNILIFKYISVTCRC